MKRFLICLLVVGAAAVLGMRSGSEEARVAWQGKQAGISWQEDLADPKASANEVPFSILTGPYLSWLTPTSATIGWEVIAEKSLTAKPYASLSGTYPDAKIQFRSVRLKGLQPDTTYRYRLKTGNGAWSYEGKEFAFRTLPPPEAQSMRFAVIGDTQRGDSKPEAAEVERKLFGLIHAWGPSLVLHMGDLLDTGRGDGINGHKAWYRAFERNREMRASTFMAPTLGNHCWLGKGHGWFADYFADLAAQPAGSDNKAVPPFHYSFDVANVHFICLCSEAARISGGKNVTDERLRDLPFSYADQLRWLEKDLAATKAPWKVVFFHKPLHTVGGYPSGEDFRKDVGTLLDKHGVQLVLSGHDHSYQKTWRIRNVTRERADTGSVQVVSGGGDTKQFDRTREAGWNIVHQKINHYLQVIVTENELRVQAVDVNGAMFDAWRLPMTGQPEAVQAPK